MSQSSVNCSRNGALRVVGCHDISCLLLQPGKDNEELTVKVGLSAAEEVEVSATEVEDSSRGTSASWA